MPKPKRKIPAESQPKYTERDIKLFKAQGQVTSNGVTYDVKGVQRKHFTLIQEKHHTSEDMTTAKHELQKGLTSFTIQFYNFERWMGR